MTRDVRVERHIAAPPDRVWALLADATSYAAWNPSIVRIEGDMSLGSTVRLVSTVAPKRTFAPRVTVREAPHRMVWTDGMPLGLFTGERTFELVPRDGGTAFSMTESFRGALSGLITRAIPDMTASFAQYADGLKAAAEQPQTEATPPQAS